ncbi:MAG TPA: aminotransferase class III-fold pyridoxal phosphate-dependent enzyme [Candidatus Sulfotelmatobacter sp.]|nr:aminotransferase class III-fold pyridoxal phosphate-dependent enzyme [Candidatus Sulfotelmatobacter sp.]
MLSHMSSGEEEVDLTSDLEARAERVLAGGCTHIARAYQPALQVERAEGSRKWLIDGRELVDYTMGHGALLLGHAHPAVIEAVRRQVARGTHYGAGHPLEIEWGERIVALVSSVERVRFTSSGTEAGMLALRIARSATGRDAIVKIDDHFHGWYDAVTVNLDEQGRPAAPPGVPEATAELTRVVRADDVESLRLTLEDRRAAALIIEATGAHYGNTPIDPDFVRAARELCTATGTVLVIDEVISGFRVAPGGLQALLGIDADLTMFAKIVAGGLPGGAVGGRAELMDELARPSGSGGRLSSVRVAHPGTYNANPLSASAGISTLDIVAHGEPQQHAERHAIALEEAWRDAMRQAGVAGRVWRFSSIVHCALEDGTANPQLGNALRRAGVDLLHTSAFCSAVHTDDDLNVAAEAMSRALDSVSQLTTV